MNEITQEITQEIRGIELSLTPPDELVAEIDRLIEDEILPESYLMQLSAAILRHNNDIYDMTAGPAQLDGNPHPLFILPTSFLLFSARVLNYELFTLLRRCGEKRSASVLHKYLSELERISQKFDNSYKGQLGVAQSPCLSSAFWEGRPSHPVSSTRKLISEGYV